MSWAKTTSGELINLDAMQEISLSEPDPDNQICQLLARPDLQSDDCYILMIDTKENCEIYLALLATSLGVSDV